MCLQDLHVFDVFVNGFNLFFLMVKISNGDKNPWVFTDFIKVTFALVEARMDVTSHSFFFPNASRRVPSRQGSIEDLVAWKLFEMWTKTVAAFSGSKGCDPQITP